MIQYEHPSPQDGDEDRYEPADDIDAHLRAVDRTSAPGRGDG